MRQSNNRKSRDVTVFLYERLSRDDNMKGESYSIGNQKKLLTKVAKEKTVVMKEGCPHTYSHLSTTHSHKGGHYRTNLHTMRGLSDPQPCIG